MRSFFSVASLSMGSLRGNLGFNEETPIRTATCGVGKTLDERFSFEFEFQILNQADQSGSGKESTKRKRNLFDFKKKVFDFF